MPPDAQQQRWNRRNAVLRSRGARAVRLLIAWRLCPRRSAKERGEYLRLLTRAAALVIQDLQSEGLPLPSRRQIRQDIEAILNAQSKPRKDPTT